MMTDKIVDSSRKLALALGTKGLVNIQYLIWENELYVIEVNPRASRTVPYISKVTGVPDGGCGSARHARHTAQRPRLRHGAAPHPAVLRGQGAGVLV